MIFMKQKFSRHGSAGRPRHSAKKNGPSRLFRVLLLLLVLITVLCLFLFSGKERENPLAGSGVSSKPEAPVSSRLEPSPPPSRPEVSVSPAEPEPTPLPERKPPAGDPEQLGALLKIGDTGYEYYNFVTDFANQYISTVARAGEQLEGRTLFDLVIPTSMSVMLPESYLEQHEINSSDQRKAIEEYLYPSINGLNPAVKTVSLFDPLRAHAEEYIYFRTDHHWTQLGAYYAYVEFCKAKGIEPVPLTQFDKQEYPGFLGSFYSDAPNEAMESNPDTVEAYVPRGDISLSYTTVDGETYGQALIEDGSVYASELLYLIFAAGDQPYEEIVNHDLADGPTCIVVKESFGNVFLPFLANHYHKVIVVDYRYYDGSIAELAAETGAEDVLLLNNISMTRNEELVNDLSDLF